MAYIHHKQRPAGLSGILDDLKSLGAKTFEAFGAAKQAQGAAQALSAQTAQPLVMQPASSGPSPVMIAVVAGVGIGAVLLLKKRKK